MIKYQTNSFLGGDMKPGHIFQLAVYLDDIGKVVWQKDGTWKTHAGVTLDRESDAALRANEIVRNTFKLQAKQSERHTVDKMDSL